MSDGVAFWSDPGDHPCNSCGGSHPTMAEVMTCSPPSEREPMSLKPHPYLRVGVLLAENASLRKQLAWFTDREPDVTRTIAEVIELRASVDKLREALWSQRTGD